MVGLGQGVANTKAATYVAREGWNVGIFFLVLVVFPLAFMASCLVLFVRFSSFETGFPFNEPRGVPLPDTLLSFCIARNIFAVLQATAWSTNPFNYRDASRW